MTWCLTYFHVLFAICVFFFYEVSVQVFAHVLNWVGFFPCCWVLRVICIFSLTVLYQICIFWIFFLRSVLVFLFSWRITLILNITVTCILGFAQVDCINTQIHTHIYMYMYRQNLFDNIMCIKFDSLFMRWIVPNVFLVILLSNINIKFSLFKKEVVKICFSALILL